MSALLWEVRHPYYCAEVQPVTEYSRWETFMEELGGSDPDLNLVVRWDWWVREDADEELPPEYLEIAMLHQRKAVLHTIRIEVRPSQDAEIRAWLAERYKTIQALWEPISTHVAEVKA